MEPEGSLPYSQAPAYRVYWNKFYKKVHLVGSYYAKKKNANDYFMFSDGDRSKPLTESRSEIVFQLGSCRYALKFLN